MTPVVHILATCRKEELLPATLLVFDTIRIGFPTANIHVWKNATGVPVAGDEIRQAAARVDADLTHTDTVHHNWIENLVMGGDEPFWICDTDVMFHDRVEHWEFTAPMAGRYIPEFVCDFMQRITHARLHASLMWFDPEAVRRRIADVNSISPKGPYTTPIPFFAPLFYARHEKDYLKHCFFDTCGQLYHCIGGHRFSREQNAAFDHLHGGTYSDIMEERMPGIQEKHRAVFAQPSLLKGAVEHQNQYFNDRAVQTA